MTSTKQIITVIIGSLLLIGGLSWMGAQGEAPVELLTTDTEDQFQAPLTVEENELVNPNDINAMNPVATFTTTKGVFTIELFADLMPVTAGNFVTLAESGYYDGTKFHRVMENFMIQGGDPNTKTPNEATWGTGGPGYAIADEHIASPELSNTRGSISMANSGPNSGGSQFFINVVDNTFLDFDKEPLNSKHPVFGRVIDGMDIVDSIVKVETKSPNIPVEPIIIESVKITTPAN